jgi:5-hydroxyisourate hydrolase-like protein (transthyretin family)
MNKFLFLVFLLAACSKDPEVTTTSVKVVDAISGSPVAGADVVLFKCGNLGCSVSSTTVFSAKTDNNGTVNVPSSDYQDASNELNVYKSDYLDFEVQRSTTLSLRPKGYIQFHVVKAGNYPDGSRLAISNPYNTFDVLVNAPADSTLVMYGAGGVLNTVSWQVLDPQGQLLNGGGGQVQVPRHDTTNVTLNY